MFCPSNSSGEPGPALTETYPRPIFKDQTCHEERSGRACEPTLRPLLELGVALCLIALNGLFSLSELAVVSARRARLKTMAEAGRRAPAPRSP